MFTFRTEHGHDEEGHLVEGGQRLAAGLGCSEDGHEEAGHLLRTGRMRRVI